MHDDDPNESHFNVAVLAAAQVAAAIASNQGKGEPAEDIADLSVRTFAAVLDEALSRLGDGEEDDDDSDEDDESEDGRD